MILFHDIGLEDRIPLLRVTIELYMQLTNRNMEPYHTDITLASLYIKHAQWQMECTKLLDSLHEMEEFKGKKFSDTTNLNLPKIHDVWHLVGYIPERGPTLFHSTEGWVHKSWFCVSASPTSVACWGFGNHIHVT